MQKSPQKKGKLRSKDKAREREREKEKHHHEDESGEGKGATTMRGGRREGTLSPSNNSSTNTSGSSSSNSSSGGTIGGTGLLNRFMGKMKGHEEHMETADSIEGDEDMVHIYIYIYA